MQRNSVRSHRPARPATADHGIVYRVGAGQRLSRSVHVICSRPNGRRAQMPAQSWTVRSRETRRVLATVSPNAAVWTTGPDRNVRDLIVEFATRSRWLADHGLVDAGRSRGVGAELLVDVAEHGGRRARLLATTATASFETAPWDPDVVDPKVAIRAALTSVMRAAGDTCRRSRCRLCTGGVLDADFDALVS